MLPARESRLRSERVCSSALEQEFQQPESALDGGAPKLHTCTMYAPYLKSFGKCGRVLQRV